MTGSSLPSRAAWVRFWPNWSRTSELDGASPPEPEVWAPAVGRLLALEAAEQLDDLLADPVEVGAELLQDLGRDALALPDQAEQDVLGADVGVAELERLAERELEHLLGARRERDVAGRGLLALPDDLLDLGAHGLQGDVEGLEGLGCDALALVDEAEQDVLGPDVVVGEHAGLFLGQHDNSPGSVGEPLEHVRSSTSAWSAGPPPGRECGHWAQRPTSAYVFPAHRRARPLSANGLGSVQGDGVRQWAAS